MKKIIAAGAALCLYCIFGAKKAEAWFTATHQDITQKSIALLEKDGKAKAYNFFKPYIKQITEGAIEPDAKGDCDKGAGMHYYSCSTPKGKELPETAGYYKNRVGKFSKSARSMLEENYTSALCLYKSGETEKAMHVLGRAIHFIEDIGCTVHSSNIKYLPKPTNVHNAYEKHINTVCKQYTAEKLDKRLTKAYSSESFESAANRIAKNSARFAETVSRLDPKAFDETAAGTLTATQQHAAALLLKFFDDCNSENGNYLTDKKSYTFKNEMTGLILTATPKGLTVSGPDKDKEQKLQLNIYDLGSFGIKVADGGFVSGNCKSYDYLKIGATPALFRFAALGRKRFRITTGATDYEKVLCCTKTGALAISDFEPGNNAQVWIIG